MMMEDDEGLRLLLLPLPQAVALHLLRRELDQCFERAITVAQEHASTCEPCPHWIQPTAGLPSRPPYWEVVDAPDLGPRFESPVREVIDVLELANLGGEALDLYVRLAHRRQVAHHDAVDLIPSLMVSHPMNDPVDEGPGA